jgi:RNA polymerase sigma-70 factor (ECF subfamily)
MSEPDEHALVAGLRAGDEAAFRALLARYHGPLRRLARAFVSSDAAADEVVQDTWVAVLDGVAAFEARSSVKTWIFKILVNRARTKGVREARSIPASALGSSDADLDGPDPARFDERGMWRDPPTRWDAETPEKLLLEREAVATLARAMQELPERQRLVVVLRDALGWTAAEVCNVLDLEETNQRVLLHRGRTLLRARLEQYRRTR